MSFKFELPHEYYIFVKGVPGLIVHYERPEPKKALYNAGWENWKTQKRNSKGFCKNTE